MVDRDFEHMQEIPTHPFFHHEILEDTPCPKFLYLLRQTAVQCRNEIESVRQKGSAVTKRSLSVRQCQNEVPD